MSKTAYSIIGVGRFPDSLSASAKNVNDNLLHLYSALLGTQSASCGRGDSPQPPPMCSIQLDDATAAILCQNAHHTPAYCCRGDRVMKANQCMAMIRRPMGKFGQDTGVKPYSFSKDILGFFVTTDSGPRFKVSSEGRLFTV